ncbi:nitroreductase family protein, partial [Clostridium botulinum CFSAN001627]
MDFIDLAKERYSVRNFDTKKIEQEKLNLILKAG